LPCSVSYRSNAWVTRARLCVRCVLCWSVFPMVPGLGSANSATCRPALFIGFIATMPESDFSGSCISGFGSSPSRCGPFGHNSAYGRYRDLPVPAQGASVYARVQDHAAGSRNDAPASVAFRGVNNVGTRVYNAFAAQWLAYTLPYRRSSRRTAHGSGATWVATPSIAVDSHHTLLAGLPALTRVAACTLARSPKS